MAGGTGSALLPSNGPPPPPPFSSGIEIVSILFLRLLHCRYEFENRSGLRLNETSVINKYMCDPILPLVLKELPLWFLSRFQICLCLFFPLPSSSRLEIH